MPNASSAPETALRLTLAQINPTVGDVGGNTALIRAVFSDARDAGSDLVMTGELAIAGYPPEDLVLKQSFLERVESAVRELAGATRDSETGLLLGAPWRKDGKLYNAAILLADGEIKTMRFKHELPNYGVFDEKRLFEAGPLPGPVPFKGHKLGVMVCEDMWFGDVAECLSESGAEILLVLNGSPYDVNKPDERLNYAAARVRETNLALVYVNQIGGQDELVFDGGSFVLDAECNLSTRLPGWESRRQEVSLTFDGEALSPENGALAPAGSTGGQLYHAMVTGLRNYVGKNGFPGVVLGMSGGVDSALSAAVAVDALGADKVHCVMMPSPYTSRESLEDAAECANLLGVRLDDVSIRPGMAAMDEMLGKLFEGRDRDITEENIQSRLRGLTLMALSNKFGKMLLTTGNKSEMSVGYATIYGDMCGGYSVLKDVYKTSVFQLCHWRNQNHGQCLMGPEGRVIPDRIITKPPSAELRPGQKDEDSLPPYDVLDAILIALIEGEKSIADLVAEGFDEAAARRVWTLLDRAEYKRRQAPPGVKVTSKAFGRERRYPITNGFTKQI